MGRQLRPYFTLIKNFLDRCVKRKYLSKSKKIRELLEKADKSFLRANQVTLNSPYSQSSLG